MLTVWFIVLELSCDKSTEIKTHLRTKTL